MFSKTMIAIGLSVTAFIAVAEPVKTETAVLAGGCFWCIESDYEKHLDGVIEVESGYAGGHLKDPTYHDVSGGKSGHIEVVRVTYDANKVNYAQILDFFWRHVDPTRDDGQFCDGGPQYRPAIFYKGAEQERIARESKAGIIKTKPFPDPIKVELIPDSQFYLAEDYHQDYYKKNPVRYNYYRFACRRDARVEDLWGEEKS